MNHRQYIPFLVSVLCLDYATSFGSSKCKGISQLNRVAISNYCNKYSTWFMSHHVSQVEDDGFSISNGKTSRFWATISRKFFKKQPGALILVRHGESEWNFNKTFTGWVDVDLSGKIYFD